MANWTLSELPVPTDATEVCCVWLCLCIVNVSYTGGRMMARLRAHVILWQESLVGENNILHVYCKAKLDIQYIEVNSDNSAHVLIKMTLHRSLDTFSFEQVQMQYFKLLLPNTGVHAFTLCVVPLSWWPLAPEFLQSSVMEVVWILVVLLMKYNFAIVTV